MARAHFRLLGLLAAMVLPWLGGCSFGPVVVRSNVLRYNEAVADTEKKQVLLNLVRLRYRDRPKVMGIPAINSQFTFYGEAPGLAQLKKIGDPVRGEIIDSPTVTLSPLGGADFTLGLLRPVELEQMGLLINTGWDLDRVLRVLVHTMNGLENAPHTGGLGEERTPRFSEFNFAARQLAELHQRGLLEWTSEKVVTPLSYPLPEDRVKAADVVQAARDQRQFHQAAEGGPVMLTEKKATPMLRIAPQAWTIPEVAEAGRLLSLTPGLPAYRLVPAEEGHLKAGAAPARCEVAVSMRSLLGASFFLSKGVEVPREHYEQGLVAPAVDEQGQPFDWTQLTEGVFRVHVCRKRPPHAFVAIKYRCWWFYVADDDLTSKSTMLMIMQLYDLQIAHLASGPLLTLPVSQARGGGS